MGGYVYQQRKNLKAVSRIMRVAELHSRTSYTFLLKYPLKKSEISIGDADNMLFCSARGGFISRSVEFRLLEGKILSPVLFLDKLGWLLYSLLQKQGLINVLKIGS